MVTNALPSVVLSLMLRRSRLRTGSSALLKSVFTALQNGKYLGHRQSGTSPAVADPGKSSPHIHLSDSCIERMKSILGKDEYLRIVVDGGGCSGFQYVFQIDPETNSDDCIVEEDGVRVVVDATSLDFLRGSTIDYHKELIRSSFRVLNNPRAENGCSCGASFSIKL